MANAVQLSNVSGTLLPPTITEPIFQKAAEQSAVMGLARRVPLSVNAQTAIPVNMDVPTPGWVNEGGVKPVGNVGTGVKIMTGKKVALIVPVSQEVASTNPGGLYEQLKQDLPTGIARAFDYACIQGKDLRTGNPGPFADYLSNTPNSQVIGATSAANGGVYSDLVKGIQQVVNAPTPGYEFSGFAADPRLKPELMLSIDLNGRPLALSANATSLNGVGNMQTLIDYPAYYNPGVSGKYIRQGNAVQVVTLVGSPTGGTFTVTVGGNTTAALAYNATGATVTTAVQALGSGSAFGGNSAAAGCVVTGSGGGPYTFTFSGPSAPVSISQKALTGGTAAASQATVAQTPNADTGLRAIGGDWSQAAWGQGMDISIKVSDTASYVDGAGVTHSAFQENLLLLLVEAYFGFVMGDPNAFVAYTHAPGS